ncbi:hypothetical protein Misp01_66480 [Microtetraspora sp. NBRC 13810]|uniref:hypothetical protein n=1 Tax=Microtetraspora sp. NBRC 13810 TaxID=3030990 RepID=UPI0024A05A8F|nr:hypothetical protein [Microtetraspora sp. NBRC 13810]GLW11520.1 hypothetical protein Misp01_66480 [Microtetraspora sp. NBRC 13810]
MPQEFLEAGRSSENGAVFRRRTLLATLSALLVVALAAADSPSGPSRKLLWDVETR